LDSRSNRNFAPKIWSRMIDFSLPINPLGLSKRAEKRFREDWRIICQYPDPHSEDLRQALAAFHGLEPSQILAGCGSSEFLYAIPRVLGIRRALIVAPTRGDFEQALETNPGVEGCHIHYFETREEEGFEIQVEALLFALTEGYDALYLANPGFPTGIPLEKDALISILDHTERQNTWFILDESFIDFLEEYSLKTEVAPSSRLILLRSFSPFFALPGLRLGYLISNPAVVQKFAQGQAPWRVNIWAQRAGIESLKDRSHIARTRAVIAKERVFLTQGLQSIPGLIPYPSQANYLLVQIHPSLRLSAGELRDRLMRERVLIQDCSSFPFIGPYFFQIAVRGRRENRLLLKTLRKVIEGSGAGDAKKSRTPRRREPGSGDS